jgi:hypothetical protein
VTGLDGKQVDLHGGLDPKRDSDDALSAELASSGSSSKRR